MESLIEIFHIDFKLLAAQLFNFGVVFFVLYYFILRPLLKTMRERSKKIESGLQFSEQMKKEMGELQEQKEAVLSEARKQGDLEIELAKQAAEAKKKEMLDNAQSTAQDIVAIAKTQAINEKEKIIDDAKQDIIDLSFALAQKALSQRIGEKEDEKLIKNIIGK